MKRLVPVNTTIDIDNKPYNDEIWYSQYDELNLAIDQAYRDGYFTRSDLLVFTEKLERITSFMVYENLSDNSKMACSDELDLLFQELTIFIKERQEHDISNNCMMAL